MNSMTPIPSTARPETAHSAPIAAGNATPTDVAGTSRVLRNTYALLSMTLLFSAAIAAASVAFQLPLLSAGLILFETSRIVTGGETNYVLVTVGLYVSIFNLFTSLLSLFGFGSSDE